MSDYLLHHGVKGMHWGIRRRRPKKQRKSRAQSKSDEYREKLKKMYGKEAQLGEADLYRAQVDYMTNSGYKKWATDNFLGELSDKHQKEQFNNLLSASRNNIKRYERYAMEAEVMAKNLDSIDTSSMSYKKAKALMNKHFSDYLNGVYLDGGLRWTEP